MIGKTHHVRARGTRRKRHILDSLGFKIVVVGGTATIPGFQTVRRLGLDIRPPGSPSMR